MSIDTAFLATKTIANVKLAYGKALAATFGIPTLEFAITAGASSVYAAAKRAVGGMSEDAYDRKNVLALGNSIDKWILRLPEMLQSKNLEQWVRIGQNLATDAGNYSNYAVDASFFSNVAKDAALAMQTTGQAVSDIYNKSTKPTEWPWYVQAAVGGVALFYASQIFRNFRGK